MRHLVLLALFLTILVICGIGGTGLGIFGHAFAASHTANGTVQPPTGVTLQTAGLQVVPQKTASPVLLPDTSIAGGLRVQTLALPTLGTRLEAKPYLYPLVQQGDAYIWQDNPAEREKQGCWALDNRPAGDDGAEYGSKNIVIWCHRGASVNFGYVDFAKLNIGDPVRLWGRDPSGTVYFVEAAVRWMGLLPREVQEDFVAETDGWAVTLITCAKEKGLPANPTKRIFVRATLNPQTNFAAIHVVGSSETLSAIAKRYDVSSEFLKTANGLKDANKVRVGQLLTIPLTQKAIVEDY